MAILEELLNQETTTSGQQTEVATEDGEQPEDISDVMLPPKKVAVVHAMGKPTWIKTCTNWADHFIAILESKVKEYEEIHLVFDRYDLPISLKAATRQRRQGDRAATVYRVEDNTPVGKVSAKTVFVECIHQK